MATILQRRPPEANCARSLRNEYLDSSPIIVLRRNDSNPWRGFVRTHIVRAGSRGTQTTRVGVVSTRLFLDTRTANESFGVG